MQLSQFKARLYQYRLPFVQPLQFGSNQLTHRQGLVLALEQNGSLGWGEIAPLPGFSKESLAQATQALFDVLNGKLLSTDAPASVQFGLDCALRPYPIHCPGTPIYPLLQGQPETILQQCLSLRDQGYRRFKLKVARHSHSQELMMLTQLAQCAKDCRFSFDANGALDVEKALELAKTLAPEQLCYFEEPCASISDIQRVAGEGIAVALDENLEAFNGPFDGLSALVIKPSLLGSLSRLEQKLNLARQYGYQAILSSSFESQLGLRHLAQISHEKLPGQEAGLGTANYFSETLLTTQGSPDLAQLDPLWSC